MPLTWPRTGRGGPRGWEAAPGCTGPAHTGELEEVSLDLVVPVDSPEDDERVLAELYARGQYDRGEGRGSRNLARRPGRGPVGPGGVREQADVVVVAGRSVPPKTMSVS